MDRRSFIACCSAISLSGILNKAWAQVSDQRFAVEVGRFNIHSRELEPVAPNSARIILYLMQGAGFGYQQVSRTGEKINSPEIFHSRSNLVDEHSGKPASMFFNQANAVKIVPNSINLRAGQELEARRRLHNGGDQIFMTPRTWIANRTGWQSLYWQLHV